ncbi:hypothetical protein HDU79_011987, partial [Rhizoclosmatium sp. JEL0117]
WITNGVPANAGFTMDELQKFWQSVALIVDDFHHGGHRDTTCDRFCNPNFVKLLFRKLGIKETVNHQAAEQRNRWISRIAHMIRDVDALQHDFYMYTLVHSLNGLLDQQQTKPASSHTKQKFVNSQIDAEISSLLETLEIDEEEWSDAEEDNNK